MHDPAEDARAGAVAALGQLDPLYLVSNFFLGLEDASAGVRLEAARALIPRCRRRPFPTCRTACPTPMSACGWSAPGC